MIPFLDLKAQYHSIKEEVDAAIANVVENTSFINGPDVRLFEQNFATAQGVKYVNGCSNGTTALHLAYELLDLQPGDEVIVPTMTFIATTEPLKLFGAEPIFIDSDPISYNMDADKIEEAITPKTKAIVAVHLHGNPCEMDKIMAIAQKHGIKVIEDSAQAHLARFNETPVANFGDMATFSFYPGKNLGAFGDAGALTTNNEALFKQAKMLLNHGRTDKYIHEFEGYNFRLSTLQAAVLNVKLKKLENWTQQRVEKADLYRSYLKDLNLQLPEASANKRHVYHLFSIVSSQRETIMEALKAKNISSGIHYPVPLHLQPAYKHLGYKMGDFPVAEKLADGFLSLPIYPELTEEQIATICTVVKSSL